VGLLRVRYPGLNQEPFVVPDTPDNLARVRTGYFIEVPSSGKGAGGKGAAKDGGKPHKGKDNQ